MKRTNTFALAPTKKQCQQLLEIADACARLWNELNYRRRQSFFKGKINWERRDLYNKYKGIIGSATAQQIQRKNNEAWKSFFTLLRQKAEEKTPTTHTKGGTTALLEELEERREKAPDSNQARLL
jgi:putative transposase